MLQAPIRDGHFCSFVPAFRAPFLAPREKGRNKVERSNTLYMDPGRIPRRPTAKRQLILSILIRIYLSNHFSGHIQAQYPAYHSLKRLLCAIHRYHRCSTQQQGHERPFESLHESPQEGEDEDDAGGGGGNEKAEYDERAETDRVAKGLMENTALEPSPPPAAAAVGAAAEAGGGRAAIDEDLPEDAGGEVGNNKLLDGDSTLGGMISPRPAEQADTDGQNTIEAAI